MCHLFGGRSCAVKIWYRNMIYIIAKLRAGWYNVLYRLAKDKPGGVHRASPVDLSSDGGLRGFFRPLVTTLCLVEYRK